MSKLSIVAEPSPILRLISTEVPIQKIGSKKIQDLIRDMSETLRGIEVGIGLAAPQVGENLRIFLASEEALVINRDEKKVDVEKYKESKASRNWKHFVFINPKLLKKSKNKKRLVEGCLSVNDPSGEIIYGKVDRFEKVSVEAYNEHGKKFKVGAKGLFAQVLQHEMDHLDGILFIDKAKEIRKIPREEVNL